MLLGPGRAAPDATVRPSPCPRRTGREGTTVLNLNLNLNLNPCTVALPRQASGNTEVRGCGHDQRRPGADRAHKPDPSFQSPKNRALPAPAEPGDSVKGFLPKPVAPFSVLSSPDQPDVPERRSVLSPSTLQEAPCLRQSRSLCQSRRARKGGGCAKQGPPARQGQGQASATGTLPGGPELKPRRIVQVVDAALP